MKISQATAKSGLTVQTVRHYANIGLVCPTTGYHHYNASDIAKPKFADTASRFDFCKKDCCNLLALYEDKDRPSRDVKKIALNKVANIDRRLRELRRLKSELAALAHACDGDYRSDCPFIEGLAVSQRRG